MSCVSLQNRRNLQRPRLQLVLAVGVGILLSFEGAGEAMAAGCHYFEAAGAAYSAEDANRAVFTADGRVTRLSNVVVLYEGGTFRYFPKLPNRPCHGPNCGKGGPGFGNATVPMQVRSVHVLVPHTDVLYFDSTVGTFSDAQLLYASPNGGGIFHPPRCC